LAQREGQVFHAKEKVATVMTHAGNRNNVGMLEMTQIQGFQQEIGRGMIQRHLGTLNVRVGLTRVFLVVRRTATGTQTSMAIGSDRRREETGMELFDDLGLWFGRRRVALLFLQTTSR